MDAMVIFSRISVSRVDVNISLEELFRSNTEDHGNDVQLVKVKVKEEKGGLCQIYIDTIANVCLTLGL